MVSITEQLTLSNKKRKDRSSLYSKTICYSHKAVFKVFLHFFKKANVWGFFSVNTTSAYFSLVQHQH